MSLKRNYRIWEDKDVVSTIKLWRKQYSDFIRVGTSQQAFGLPNTGSFDDCAYDEGLRGCFNYYFTIQDYIMHPAGSESAALLPELIWTGGWHGDEPASTTVLMEAATLLLEAAACEALPRRTSNINAWHKELQEATECRERLLDLGVDTEQRQWLARLVSTRRIVVVPIVNSLGFSRGEYNEGSHDPEQDFPYAYGQSGHCMRTIAAKTLNELFREHMFQIAMSFHDGQQGIGYSWSNEMDIGVASPDQRAQADMAEAFRTVIGPVPQYPSGQNNEMILYRNGAMEDWAYAASWDKQRIGRCSLTNVDSNSTNRAIAFTVGTGVESNFGNTLDVFNENEIDTDLGIAQPVRVALYSADLVQPFVSVRGINNMTFSDDIVPLTDPSKMDCQNVRSAAISSEAELLTVEWIVGGAIEIEETELWYAKLGNVTEAVSDCWKDEILEFDGGRRVGKGTMVRMRSNTTKVFQPIFNGEIDVSDFTAGERLLVFASAKVDQTWQSSPDEDHRPASGPQSHLVNARTDRTWHHTHADKTVDGKLFWHSKPVSIIFEDFDSNVGVIELSSRFSPQAELVNSGDVDGVRNQLLPSFDDHYRLYVAILATALAICLLVIKLLRQRAGRKGKTVLTSETIPHLGSFTSDFLDESCPVQVFGESYVHDYDDNGNDNWEIIDFTT